MASECCICFELIRSTDNKPVATRCGHIFHESCINSCFDKQNVCPQCNQPAHRFQLIRLFINQSENSDATKDDMIEKLKLQLNELTEKAQMQYDLIASLNKQIRLIESQNVQNKNESKSNRPMTSAASSDIYASKLQKDSTKLSSDSSSPFESIPTNTKNDLYKAIGCVIFGENSPTVTLNHKTTTVTPFDPPKNVYSSADVLANFLETRRSSATLCSASNSSDSSATSTTSPSQSLTKPSTSTTFSNIYKSCLSGVQLPQSLKSAEPEKPFKFMKSGHFKKLTDNSGGSKHAFKFSDATTPITSQATGFTAFQPAMLNGASCFTFGAAQGTQTPSPATSSIASSTPVNATSNLFASSSSVNSNAKAKAKSSSVFKASPLSRNGNNGSTTSPFKFELQSQQSESDKFPFIWSFSKNPDATTAMRFPFAACDTNAASMSAAEVHFFPNRIVETMQTKDEKCVNETSSHDRHTGPQ